MDPELAAARRIIEKYVNTENQTADEYIVAQGLLRLRFAMFRLSIDEAAFGDDVQARKEYARKMIDMDPEQFRQAIAKALFTAKIPRDERDQVGYWRALADAALGA
jgi:hypothetical protein